MEELRRAIAAARRTVLVPEDPQGPASKTPGHEVPSDAGARGPSDEGEGARTPPRDHGSVTERTASEVTENEVPSGSVTTPHGYFWTRDAGGHLILKPSNWFVTQIAQQADEIFASMREKLSKDEDVQDDIIGMAAALEQYWGYRAKYNQMAGDRKLRGELDDACYQLCQSAKYYLDAMERAQDGANKGRDISDDQRIQTLSDLSKSSAIEGYVIAAAVYQVSDQALTMNFSAAAWRVANYSARKLTEWFAAREEANKKRLDTSNNAALAEIVSMFGKKEAS